MPKAVEVAVLVVNGQEFRDWKTVEVSHRWLENCHIFNFTCSEKLPTPATWPLLAFKPGDTCIIQLGGILAMTGEITIRQVAYDPENHGVQLVGRSLSYNTGKSQIRPQSANLDNYTWSQIARKLLGEIGVGLETVGKLDETKFEQCQAMPGETVYACVERLARSRGIIVGSNAKGELVGIGDHESKVTDYLIEGQNIKSANCVISNESIYSEHQMYGQKAGHDGSAYKQASEIFATVPGQLKRPAYNVTAMEQPGTNAEAQLRAKFEAQWHNGTEVKAQITVQGWLRKGGDIWRVGESVWVRSPMLLLDIPMSIQTATFLQSDAQGTITVLDLVLPWFLNGFVSYATPPSKQLESGTPMRPPEDLQTETVIKVRPGGTSGVQ